MFYVNPAVNESASFFKYEPYAQEYSKFSSYVHNSFQGTVRKSNLYVSRICTYVARIMIIIIGPKGGGGIDAILT